MSADALYRQMVDDAIAAEEAATRELKAQARKLAQASEPLWHLGDGFGGWVREVIEQSFVDQGLPLGRVRRDNGHPTKRPVSSSLRWAVWERDEFTCQTCGDRRDLTIDHIVPESKGGASTLDNLQTLCRSCNSSKGVGL